MEISIEDTCMIKRYITITLKDIDKFKSIRMYISTIEQEKINSIDDKEEENSKNKFYEIYKNR